MIDDLAAMRRALSLARGAAAYWTAVLLLLVAAIVMALLDLRYLPNEPTARVTLVGKGVTFDTGGLSMKSPSAMAGMRQDKAGAATVLAVMSVLAELGVRAEVRALLPVIENMIGPHSLRPGDVVTSWNGTRIQVMDTDFEGRVILADALAAGVTWPILIIGDTMSAAEWEEQAPRQQAELLRQEREETIH